MFAEDAGLLPGGIIRRLAAAGSRDPEVFTAGLGELFRKMSDAGGLFGAEPIQWFNGGLFDGGDTLPLLADEVRLVDSVSRLDWSQVEPAIFGTLFERSKPNHATNRWSRAPLSASSVGDRSLNTRGTVGWWPNALGDSSPAHSRTSRSGAPSAASTQASSRTASAPTLCAYRRFSSVSSSTQITGRVGFHKNRWRRIVSTILNPTCSRSPDSARGSISATDCRFGLLVASSAMRASKSLRLAVGMTSQ
jgi:hypothetical protein